MKLFPDATSNKNVPRDSLLLCEYSMPGLWTISVYATDTGRIYRIGDWVSDTPSEMNVCYVAHEMGYAPITIMAKIVEWSSVAEALREAQEAAR